MGPVERESFELTHSKEEKEREAAFMNYNGGETERVREREGAGSGARLIVKPRGQRGGGGETSESFSPSLKVFTLVEASVYVK